MSKRKATESLIAEDSRISSMESRQEEVRHQRKLRRIALVSAISIAVIGLTSALIKDLVFPEMVARQAKKEQWCVRVTPRIDNKHTHCKDTKVKCEELRGFLLKRQSTSIGGVVTECSKTSP